MKQSTHRILTTHCGSLARPTELLDVMKAKVNGQPYDADKYAATLRRSVADIVSKQSECGIDIVADGEQSKPGFFTYVHERLTGFEKKDAPKAAWTQWSGEVAMFPEYYEQYFSRRMAADLFVFDPEKIDLAEPEKVADLPEGAPRYIQRAKGIRYTIVNGSVLMKDGAHTGVYPGKVLRSS